MSLVLMAHKNNMSLPNKTSKYRHCCTLRCWHCRQDTEITQLGVSSGCSGCVCVCVCGLPGAVLVVQSASSRKDQWHLPFTHKGSLSLQELSSAVSLHVFLLFDIWTPTLYKLYVWMWLLWIQLWKCVWKLQKCTAGSEPDWLSEQHGVTETFLKHAKDKFSMNRVNDGLTGADVTSTPTCQLFT